MTRTRLYNPGQLTDDELVAGFIARQRELQDVLEVIGQQPKTGPLQHMLILGERGMGKTTLGRRALIAVKRDEALSKLWEPVPFAEESYRVTSLGKLWLEALTHLSAATGDPAWAERGEELRRGEKDDDRMEARARDLLTEFREATGKRPILFIENIDEVFGQFSGKGRDMSRLRADLQSRNDFMVLGTATSRFAAITDYGKPFYQFFRLLELKGLDQAAALDVVDSMAERLGCEALTKAEQAKSGRIATIRTLTGGNPRLIHITARLVAESPHGTAMEDLERLVDEQTPYFKARVDALPAQQREIVQTLAAKWTPMTAAEIAEAVRMSSSQVSAQLKKLEEDGFVGRAPQEGKSRAYYEVTARVYSLYFVLRSSPDERKRLEALLTYLEKLYGPFAAKAIRSAALSRLSDPKVDYNPSDYIIAHTLRKYSSVKEIEGVLIAFGRLKFEKIMSKLKSVSNISLENKLISFNNTEGYLIIGVNDLIEAALEHKSHELLNAFCNAMRTGARNNAIPRLKHIIYDTDMWLALYAVGDQELVFDAVEALGGATSQEPLYRLLQREAGIELPPLPQEMRNAIDELSARLARFRDGTLTLFGDEPASPASPVSTLPQ